MPLFELSFIYRNFIGITAKKAFNIKHFGEYKTSPNSLQKSLNNHLPIKLEIHRAIRSPVGSNPTHSAKSPAAPKLSGLSFCCGKSRSNQQNVHS